jgi:hypothetical protein
MNGVKGLFDLLKLFKLIRGCLKIIKQPLSLQS